MTPLPIQFFVEHRRKPTDPWVRSSGSFDLNVALSIARELRWAGSEVQILDENGRPMRKSQEREHQQDKEAQA